MKNSIGVLVILLISFSSIISNGQARSTSSKSLDIFFKIKYEELLLNKKTIGLNQIATNVEYVQLETNGDCILAQNPNYYFTDSLIFVAQEEAVFKFTIKGKFQGKVASNGRGPNEITDAIFTIQLVPEKNEFIAQDFARRKLLFFSFNGKVVKSTNYSPHISLIVFIKDGRYVTYDTGSGGNNKYTFRLTNELNDTISVVKNYYYWQNNSNEAINWSRPIIPFYFCKDKAFLKSIYNDTVYYVSSNKILPSYYIDLGKYKLPEKLVHPERFRGTELQLYREKSEKYNFVNVFEASNKIFLTSYCYNSNINPQKYFIYDKVNKDGVFLVNDFDKSTGIVNDWDGGLDFIPVAAVNDDKIYMPISILAFQKHFKDESINKAARYSEKAKQLEKLVSESDNMGNPILMIVTLKH
jgi:hypothetical protein